MPSMCSRVHRTSRGSARRSGRRANPARALEQLEAPAGIFLQGLDRWIAGRDGRFIQVALGLTPSGLIATSTRSKPASVRSRIRSMRRAHCGSRSSARFVASQQVRASLPPPARIRRHSRSTSRCAPPNMIASMHTTASAYHRSKSPASHDTSHMVSRWRAPRTPRTPGKPGAAPDRGVEATPSAAGHAVGHLPEDVDVAVVPGGLLDQVEEHPPQRDRLLPPGQRAP
jgi:hypothetical protein